MAIIETLKKQAGLTDTEKRIAEYILDNLSDMSDINIQELAKKAYSSHSAVIRLTKKLGFSGFREFRIALVQEIQNNLYITNEVDPNFPFRPFDNSQDIAKKMADLCIESIQKTANQLDKKLLDNVAKLLIESKRIFLFGKGDSQIRARSFQNKFNKINRYLIIADEYGDTDWSALNVESDDLAIFISYRGNILEYVKHMKYLKRKGIAMVLFTSDKDSPMAQLTEFCVEVPAGEFGFVKVGTFASQISFEYVLDTLFSIVYANGYTSHLVALKNKEHILAKDFFDTYDT